MLVMVNYWGMVVTKGESWGGMLLFGTRASRGCQKGTELLNCQNVNLMGGICWRERRVQ